MPPVYQHRHTIRDDEIDSLGHANNVAYVDWLQSAAMAHSAAQGWPGERYLRCGFGWVVRSHKIEYLQPGFAGQQIVVETWVATMKKTTSLRRYHIFRETDRTLLSTAETRWAFINYNTSAPMRIPPEVADAFEIVDRSVEESR